MNKIFLLILSFVFSITAFAAPGASVKKLPDGSLTLCLSDGTINQCLLNYGANGQVTVKKFDPDTTAASVTDPGIVTTDAQTFGGTKTFSNGVNTTTLNAQILNGAYGWSGTGAYSTGVNLISGTGGALLVMVSSNVSSGDSTTSALYMIRKRQSGTWAAVTTGDKNAVDNATVVEMFRKGTTPVNYTFSAVSNILNVTASAAGNHKIKFIEN